MPIASVILTSSAIASPAVPVRVGGDFEFPACEERGVVNERNAQGGRVDVSSGPTPGFQPIARLPVGAQVYICDENGTFLGVIYGDDDCGLAEPIERRAAYRGGCSSGWLHNRSIDRSTGDEAGDDAGDVGS